MPIYTYRCEAGHQFDIVGKMDRSDEPKTCPRMDDELTQRLHVETTCGKPIERQMALNAKSFPGADSWRK